MAAQLYDNGELLVCPDSFTSLATCSDVTVGNNLDLSGSETVRGSERTWELLSSNQKMYGIKVKVSIH